MKIILNMLMIFICCANLNAQSSVRNHALMDLDCANCHSCEKPSYEDPCLKICPDFKRSADSHKELLENAPELLILDNVTENYSPSLFPHKLHAEMMEMSQGCATCHHYNLTEKILSCSECHVPDKDRADLSKPGLVGAFHQQCMDCHLGRNKDTDCSVCHNLGGLKQTHEEFLAKNPFLGKSHFALDKPAKIVKQTEFEEGPVVTFYHNAHVKQYGISCMTCHKSDACSDCHESVRPFAKTEHETHAFCISCHEDAINDNCNKCHDTKKKAPFNHAQVGWPLNEYHAKLSCQSCHEGTSEFSKLNKTCTSCHNNWTLDTFDHKITGIGLDEIHAEFDCETCHLDRNFSKKPDCSMCHDEMQFPKQIPGRRLSRP